MFGYKCDKCGRPVNVDPGEERICDDCMNVDKSAGKPQVKIVYCSPKKERQYAG